MEITFYNNTSAHNVVNKVLTGSKAVTGDLVNDYNEDTPQFSCTINLSGYNYALINGAYYYITGVTYDTNNTCVISFKLDVLMTFKGELAESNIYATRCSTGDPYLKDELVPINEKRTIATQSFDGFVDDLGCWILITTQSGYSEHARTKEGDYNETDEL